MNYKKYSKESILKRNKRKNIKKFIKSNPIINEISNSIFKYGLLVIDYFNHMNKESKKDDNRH
jgi:hypothetical protein